MSGDTFTGNSTYASGNTYTYGGGVYNAVDSVVHSTGDTFTDNSVSATAESFGAGLKNDGTATVTGDTFTGNAANVGGGISLQGVSF
ncbi:MAG TPA: hypothetical protein VGH33_21795, partial [Isosphaeraceae bacterium]